MELLLPTVYRRYPRVTLHDVFRVAFSRDIKTCDDYDDYLPINIIFITVVHNNCSYWCESNVVHFSDTATPSMHTILEGCRPKSVVGDVTKLTIRLPVVYLSPIAGKINHHRTVKNTRGRLRGRRRSDLQIII